MANAKDALRRQLRILRKGWDEDYCLGSDKAIATYVLTLDEWRRAGSIFIYVSVRTEPDTRSLISSALSQGKRVAVPRCEAGGIMHAHEITSFEQLHPAGYGLLEPPETAPLIDPGELELAVIPCVAADIHLNRLGHGAGYYDGYLTQVKCTKVCLCRARELLDSVPVDQMDVPMDMIITENGIMR